MKKIILLILTFIGFANYANGQDWLKIFELHSSYYSYKESSDFGTPDSFATVKLEYETLDSTTIIALNPRRNIHFPNIVSYESEGEIKLAYFTIDKNEWTSVFLPFNSTTNNFNLVNLDKKGQAELIIEGEIANYGSGGGTGIRGMVIINIDSIPTQIFKIYYGCWIESFGDRHNNGEGRFFKEYEREIIITDNSIIIGSLDKKEYPFYECELTKIPSGIYIMEAGQIRKKYADENVKIKNRR